MSVPSSFQPAVIASGSFAVLARIQALTEHLKTHDKDHASRRGLLKMVGHRRKLLKYLRTVDSGRHQEVLNALGLRR